MKTFFRKYKAGHVWLLILAAFFALYFLCRRNSVWMNVLCSGVLLPWERMLGRLCGQVSVSVAEVLILSALFGLFFYLTWIVRQVIRDSERGSILYRAALNIVCMVLTVWALFCLFWGTFYQTDSFQERSGITARGGTVAELTELTRQFADGVAACADAVPRDEQGCFGEKYQVILSQALDCYPNLYEEFPFLDTPQSQPKAFVASRALSALDFTGFYFPLTGETNVNIDAPTAYLPATLCHELAHQRGIASEQECNFLGILAAIRSEEATYRYSGYLLGYVYLGNALYRADHEAWQRIWDDLPLTVIADLRANNDYWAQFEGPVRQTAQTVYDGFLKSNGDALGIQSYGTVVDMLMGYYMG